MSSPVPIQRQGATLIASVRSSLTDDELEQLGHDLVAEISDHRSKSILLDIGQLDVVDSFSGRQLQQIAVAARLRGARMMLVGLRPEAALAMVQLGLTLQSLETALDVDDGLARLQAKR